VPRLVLLEDKKVSADEKTRIYVDVE
jgi:hypothetical protein